MFSIQSSGSFKNTYKFLDKMKSLDLYSNLRKYGEAGVNALSNATPIDSGKTADAWYYEIEESDNYISIIFKNRNNVNGANIALMLQYGHGTGTGGYVQGRDYINPSIQPVFDKILEDAWKEVTSA